MLYLSVGWSGENIEMESLFIILRWKVCLLSCAWFGNINQGRCDPAAGKDAIAGPARPGQGPAVTPQRRIRPRDSDAAGLGLCSQIGAGGADGAGAAPDRH